MPYYIPKAIQYARLVDNYKVDYTKAIILRVCHIPPVIIKTTKWSIKQL